jgi:hypothetical protein
VTETPNFALSTHASEAPHVWSMSVYNEGYFTLEAKKVFRHYLASHLSGVTETSNLAVFSYAPEGL